MAQQKTQTDYPKVYDSTILELHQLAVYFLSKNPHLNYIYSANDNETV